MSERDIRFEFIQHLAGKGLSDATIKEYVRYYDHFINGLEDHNLNQSFINQFIISHPSNVTRSFLSNLFNYLEIKGLKIPKLTGAKGHKERKSLTPQEIKVLRQWLYVNENIRYLLCFDLSYTCALRRSEVMAIKIKDFQLKEWIENPENSCKLLIHGKRNRERYVPVKSSLMLRILEYVEDKGKTEEDRLFSFSYRQWDKAFKKAVKSTMDYNYTLHDLRRSRATQWIKEGKDLTRVKNRLGHASVQTTQLYINLDKEKEFESWANE